MGESMVNGVIALKMAIAFHENALRSLNDALHKIQAFNPVSDPRRFTGKRLAIALEEYLEDCGGKSYFFDCLDRLKEGGAFLGQRPEANLKTVVSTNPDRFRLDGDDVLLVPRAHLRAA